MARARRIRRDGDAHYHLMSRTNDRRFLFSKGRVKGDAHRGRLGTQDFTRLKLGVGKDRSDVIAHVLGKFDPTTRKTMDLVVAEAVKAAAAILRDGPDRA